MNISEEAIKEFSAIIAEHFAAKEKALKEEYAQRLNKAKQVCVEEVETHKAALSRGIQRFLEAKVASVEKVTSRRHAIEESEATTKLKQLKALLEGINVDGPKDNQALQAAQERTAALEKQLAESREALQCEKAKSIKLSEIAQKSVARQTAMEAKVTTLVKQIEESKATAAKATEKTLAEEKQAAEKPKTVVKENKEQAAAKPAAKQEPSKETPSEIDVIAESIEDR